MNLKGARFRPPESRVRRALLLMLMLFLIGGTIGYFVFGSNRSTAPRTISLTALTQRIKSNDIREIRAGDGDGVATARSGEMVILKNARLATAFGSSLTTAVTAVPTLLRG